MTPGTLLEVWASLSLQVALMICVVGWAARRVNSGHGADWSWAALYVAILGITAAAFLLPHLRPITLAAVGHTVEIRTVQIAFTALGYLCGWVWLVGTGAMLCAIAGGVWRAARLVREATPHDQLTQLANDVPRAGRSRPDCVEVRVSGTTVSPFCWQFHRPVIVVPDLLLDFPPAEQAAVLKHELAHLRAQHPLHVFLQRLVEAIYWFHPLVWWASWQAGAAREFRCDRDAVASRQEVADYLRSLLRLIEAQIPPPNRLPAGLGFLGDAPLLSRRAATLAEMLEHPLAQNSVRRPALALLAAGATCLIVWLPINPQASRRTLWSPWPTWSASALDVSGFRVRDYEIDGHRLQLHEHRSERR